MLLRAAAGLLLLAASGPGLPVTAEGDAPPSWAGARVNNPSAWENLPGASVTTGADGKVETVSLDTSTSTQLANDFVDLMAQRGRNLAPSGCPTAPTTPEWCAINEYFMQPSTAYIGIQPGPCPTYKDGKCEGWACQMPEGFKQTTIDIPILGPRQVQELVHTETSYCPTWPGKVNLYNLFFGNLKVNKIDLAFNVEDYITPSQGWPAGSCPPSTVNCAAFPTPSPNHLQVTFTLYGVQFDGDIYVRIRRLRTKEICTNLIPPGGRCDCGWTCIKIGEIGIEDMADVRATLARSDQGNGVYFRSIINLYSNYRCNPANSPLGISGACIVEPGFYYPNPSPDYGYPPNTYPQTEAFARGIIFSMDYVRNGAQYNRDLSCTWNVDGNEADFGLSLDMGYIIRTGWGWLDDAIRTVVNWVVTQIVNAIIKDILCDMWIQTAYEIDGSQNIIDTRPGIFNNGLRNVYDKLRSQVAKGLRTKQKEELDEDVNIPNYFINEAGYPPNFWPVVSSGYRPYPGAVDFNTSKTFKAVSRGLNGILGNLSKTAGYENKLVIVEVIDILTGNKDGVIPLGICRGNTESCTLGYCAGKCDGDIKKELNLADYPRFTWGDKPYQDPGTRSPSSGGSPDTFYPCKYQNQVCAPGANMFNGMVELRGLELSGVNSFTVFEIMDNGFANEPSVPVFTHTLANHVSMTKLGLKAVVAAVLTDGYWIHRPNPYTNWPNTISPSKGSIDVDFSIDVSLTNIDALIDVMALLIPDGMKDIYVGQIFGNLDTVTQRVKCAAFGLDWVHIQKFQLAGTLNSITLTDFLGTGVGKLVAKGTEIFQKGLTPATAYYLRYVCENYIREKINDYLLDNTFDGPYNTPSLTDECVPLPLRYYYAANDPARWVNFTGSRGWDLMKGVINDVVGGRPVRTGSASVNSIIQAYLEWYLPTLKNITVRLACDAETPLDGGGYCTGNWDVVDGEFKLEGNTADKYLTVNNFRVRNLDSIHELYVWPQADHELLLSVKIGGGKIYERTQQYFYNPGYLTLAFDFKTEVNVYRPGYPQMFLYADDEAQFYMRLGNLTFTSAIEMRINQNDLLELKFGNLNKLACILSVLDYTYMKSLDVGFGLFRLNVSRPWRSRSQCSPGSNGPWNPALPAFVQPVCCPACGFPAGGYRIVKLSDALDYLKWEAEIGHTGKGWGPKVDNMLLYFFKGLAGQVKDKYNQFTGYNYDTAGCETKKVFSTQVGEINMFEIFNAFLNNATNVSRARSWIERLTEFQDNPRFPKYMEMPYPHTQQQQVTNPLDEDFNAGRTNYHWGFPATRDPNLAISQLACTVKGPWGYKEESCWEDDIILGDDPDAIVDLRTNVLVKSVQKYLSYGTGPLLNKLLKNLADVTDLVLAYRNGTLLPINHGPTRGQCNTNGVGSYCVDLDITDLVKQIPLLNVTNKTQPFLPGLLIYPRRLFVQDIHTFNLQLLELLKPYVRQAYDGGDNYDDDARFTLQHRIFFDNLRVVFELDVSVDEIFVNATTTTPNKVLTDTIFIDFNFKKLDLQILTTTAVNFTRFRQVPLANLLNPNSENKCFFSMFFENGLYLPQLQLYVDDLEGPTVKIFPKGDLTASAEPKIFSGAVAALIAALIEIVFQLIRDNFPDATQGVVRAMVNSALYLVVSEGNLAKGGSGQDSCYDLPENICSWGTLPPGQENYVNFLSECVEKAFNLTNRFIGGNPITSSNFDINHLENLALEYFIEDKKALDPLEVVNLQNGSWRVPSLLGYQYDKSSINITNLELTEIDTYYKFWLSNFKGQTPPRYFDMGVSLGLGNGTYYNGIDYPPEDKVLARHPPLGFGLDFEGIVNVKRISTGQYTKLSDDQFRFKVLFSQIAIDVILEAFVDRRELSLMTFDQLISFNCYRAIIKDLNLDTLTLAFGDMNVDIPPFSGQGAFGRKFGKLGAAVDQLRIEAEDTNPPYPPLQSKPVRMLNNMVRNLGNTLKDLVNDVKFFNQSAVNCYDNVAYLRITSGIYTEEKERELEAWLPFRMPEIITKEGAAPQVQTDDNGDKVIRFVYSRKADPELIKARAITYAREINDTSTVILETASACNSLNLGSLQRVCAFVQGGGADNLTTKFKQWTVPQVNLLDRRVSKDVFESRVEIDVEKDAFYDVRTAFLVRTVTKYFDGAAPRMAELLLDVANKTKMTAEERANTRCSVPSESECTFTTSLFRINPSTGSVDLEANMTELMICFDKKFNSGRNTTCGGSLATSFRLTDFLKETNFLIPALRILPGILSIKNFGEFTRLVVMRPYKGDDGAGALFTTEHMFEWGREDRPLGVSVGIDIFFDSGFNDFNIPLGTSARTKESIELKLNMTKLLIQALTLLAVDTKRLGEVSLGDFLDLDADQIFTRNCYAINCLGASIYNGGINIPQLTLNVTDIEGPTFTTTRNLFSKGMEMFIEAIAEIFVQTFRDNFADLFQGPIRKTINSKLDAFLSKVRNPASCPPKRNYTVDYPRGQYYCSHMDMIGESPERVQDKATCENRGGGKMCTFLPPDQAYNANQTQCFYDKRALDLDFSRNGQLKRLKCFINESLLQPKSSLYINTIVGGLAGQIQTKYYETDPPLAITYQGASYGTVKLGGGRFKFNGFDTIRWLQIFDNTPYDPINGENRFVPVDNSARRLEALPDGGGGELIPYQHGRDLKLNAKTSYGKDDNNYTTRTAVGMNGPVSISFEIYLSFDSLFLPRADNPSGVVTNHMSFTLIIRQLDIVVDLFMLVNLPRLMDLQIRSIATIYELPCILAIFEPNGLVPINFNVTYGEVGFVICCESVCNSPYFKALEAACFTDAANNQLTKSFTKGFQDWTKKLIQYVASSKAQDFLDKRVASSAEQCEAIKAGLPSIPKATAKDHQPAATYFGVAGIVILVVFMCCFACCIPFHFRRKDELMKRALLEAHERGAAGKSKDEFELAERRLSNAFFHPSLPKWVFFLVPIMILSNVIMFATANFAANGATVEVTISIAGDTTVPVPILPFTLAGSINDMWNAGTKPLAFIIAIASGGWPYIKQIMLLFAWFAPATILTPKVRGTLLEVLDDLGKWSLIDVYVLVMLMVAFRFYMSSSMIEKFSLIPADALTVSVVVTPGWGIFGFLFGAMGSLVVNHIMTWWHRKCQRSDEDLQDAILGQLVKDLRTPRIPLMRHRFNIMDAEGRPYRYSALTRIAFLSGFGLLFLIIIIGSVIPVMKFVFRGVAGIAFGLLDPGLTESVQSTASIGSTIILGAKNTIDSQLGIVFLQIVYFAFALITPLLMCISMCVIWAVPLTLQEQLLLGFVIEVISAWEALAVLVVSVIAAILQISQLAQFIVDHATGSLCDLAKKPLARVFPDPEDAQCFDVKADLVPSGALIISASVLLMFWVFWCWRLVHVAITDRELAMRRKAPHSPGDMTGPTGFIVRRCLEAFGPSTGRVENSNNVANMYAQQQGAFDTRSQYTAQSGQFGGMPGNSAYSQGMGGPGVMMVSANPVLQAEMSAQNPMFAAPGGSLSKPGYVPGNTAGNRGSIEV